MNLSKISIRRPVTTVMMVLAIILLGMVSAMRIPIDLLPKLDLPIAAVVVDYEGAGPEEIENLVARPLEGVLTTVSNLKDIQTISGNEKCTAILEFNDGTDMDFAALEMREKIDLIKKMLPEGVSDPLVLKIDPNDFKPAMQLGFSADMAMPDLTNLVADQIVNRLERIDGVASVSMNGGVTEEVEVILNLKKLYGYGLNSQQLAQLLMKENLNMPSGNIEAGGKKILVRTVGEFKSIDEIENIPVTTPDGAVIFLKDIADIKFKEKETKGYNIINGKKAIMLSLQKQSTANTVQVATRINKELKKLERDFPNIKITKIYDGSEYIKTALATVAGMAIVGGILAILVLYLFLRNIPSTLIVGTAIPVSVIGTFILMYFSKLTINLISLGGLALGVGMLVDNSIVVLENIYRHRSEGENSVIAAEKGSTEVTMPVVASTLTTIAVFLPIVFVEGFAARIFREMALTVTFSLLASLFIAVTFVPMVASKILKVSRSNQKTKSLFIAVLNLWEKLFEKVKNWYKSLLSLALSYRVRTLVAAGLIFVISLISVFIVGMEYFPPFDEGIVRVDIAMPTGSLLNETALITNKIETYVGNIPEVKEIFISVGSKGEFASSSQSTDQAEIILNVGNKTDRNRPVFDIAEEIRSFVKDIPGAKISVDTTGYSTRGMTGGKPIEIEVYGQNLEKLKKITDELKTKLESVKGTREITTSMGKATEEMVIHVNRQKAAYYGITSSLVANSVRTAIKGYIATKYKTEGKEIDVRIMYNPKSFKYFSSIPNIQIKSPLGGEVPLSELADIKIQKAPVSIVRNNQKRTITISSDIVGRDLNSVTKDIDKAFKVYPFPEGYGYKYGGQQKEMFDSFKSLAFALVLAVLIVYMVLSAQFESLVHPFTIMFSVPLALTGALLALFITGKTLSIPAFVGVIMLAGIVVNNAIVLVDYVNQLRLNGLNRFDAIIQAGPVRLRPILMTTMTTVLAMLPMALGSGEGSETQAPLATAVIGGLILSTFVTLIIVPVIYSLLDDLRLRTKKNKEA